LLNLKEKESFKPWRFQQTTGQLENAHVCERPLSLTSHVSKTVLNQEAGCRAGILQK